MPLLSVRNLQTFFATGAEPCRVVDGVSFTLEAGETLGLVGESGSGKSLTALSLMHLLPRPGYHAGGEIVFDGRDLTALDAAGRRAMRGRNMAMIFQEPMTSLNPVLTVRTQLLEAIRRNPPHGPGGPAPTMPGKSGTREIRNGPEFLSSRYSDGRTGRASPAVQGRMSRDEQFRQAVEALRLAEIPDPERRIHEYPHQLSGGMRQRVMIAMALACRPRMLIADEPTTALDVTVQARILDLLRDLQARLGTAILFITHDLAVIAQVAHRVAVMYAGKIVETAPVAEIFRNPAHPYTERLLECRPRRDLRGRTLETIAGVVPSPKDYAPGCRFCDRCPHVFAPCHDIEPQPVEIGPGHYVACHLHTQGRAALALIQKTSHEEVSASPTPDHDFVLDARGVRKHFAVRKGLLKRLVGHVKAVDDVDVRVRRGTTLALVGESGCGKTTLGKTLTRLYAPTGGEILFNGRDITRLDAEAMHGVRRGIQILFQDPYSSLNPRMTVRQVVEEGLRAHGIGRTPAERNDRLRELLQQVGLKASDLDAYPHEFSGGQRQRIGIARALAVEPEFLILDEPTSALDMSIQAQILNLLRAIQGQGRQRLTYLFITHNLGVVEYMADEVAVMYLGRIVERNRTVDLFDGPRHPYTKALLASIPRTAADSRRLKLEGDVPSPLNPPRGCHFHPRCPHAMPICKEVYPPETPTGNGAMVRCHLERRP